MIVSYILSYLFLLFGMSMPATSSDHALKHHFRSHNQENWQAFESLTAKGEWHIGAADYFVRYYIKQPNKWTAIATEGQERLISNQWYAGIQGVGEAPGAVAFDKEEALALSFVWNFGSPLYPLSDQLVKKENVEVDQKPCYWYQYTGEEWVYDFFVTKSDHLFYKVTISDLEGNAVGSTTMIQYRKFGPYEMPSQVQIRTEEIDYLMVFTDYVIGDYVPNSRFSF